jgi:hypothetical protein
MAFINHHAIKLTSLVEFIEVLIERPVARMLHAHEHERRLCTGTRSPFVAVDAHPPAVVEKI